MAEHVYIGVDLGGTRIRAAQFSSDLQMGTRTETLTQAAGGPDAVIGRIADQIRAVWPKDSTSVKGIGLSVPGPSNPKTGIVVAPPNLYGWHNIPLCQIIQDTFGVPSFLGNDANLAALAEATMGAARGYEDVLFLTISTGIGGGVISAGQLLIGSDGIGAECGHIILVVDGDRVSSLELEAAGPAIARQAQEALQHGEKSKILELAGGSIADVAARHVGIAANQGDPLAVRLIERAGRMIGLGIVTFLHIFNPQIIVLSGGVFEGTGDLLLNPLRQTMQKHALDPLYWKNLVIAPAQLGENVSLIGAAALAKQQT
jgi:glucokinase